MRKITRRGFIKSTALTGLALAGPLRAKSAHPLGSARPGDSAESVDHDCIVIGAGLAGLTAAFRLRLAGHDNIRILDAHPGAGGICWARTEHGYRFPMGTTYIGKPWNGSAAKRVYEALPHTWWSTIPEPVDSSYYNDELVVDATVFRNWRRIPGITDKQERHCRALKRWFRRKYRWTEWPLYLNRGNRLDKYETMTAREMIASFRPNCDPWVLGAVDSFVRGTLNGNLDEVGGLQAIDMIGDEYVANSVVTGRTTHVVADLPDALATEIGPERFIFDARVTRVENVGPKVVVAFKQNGMRTRLSCRYCVVATNAATARSIIEDIPRRVSDVLDSISYGEYAVVNLVMEHDTVPINAFDCTLGDNIIDDIYDFTFVQKMRAGIPLGEPPGIYGCYIAARSKDDHTPTLPERKLIKLCADQLDTMFGKGTSDKVTSTHVSRYFQGMPIFHPGLTWQQEEHLIPMLNDRITLAGDYVQGSPTIEGALESGWYAAEQLI